MRKNYFRLWSMLILLFVAGKCSYAQNAFIDYENWVAPNPSPCNIFAPLQVINGYNNQTSVGQPGYSHAYDAVTLDCQIVGTSKKGTEYQIAYPFKPGFSYRVKIMAATIMSNPGTYASLLRAQITNQSLVGMSGCVGMAAILPDPPGPNSFSIVMNSQYYNELLYDFTEQSSASGYLRIGAVPQTGGSFQTMYIRSVRIEETAVNPDLTLSPSNVATTCGTDLSQTFTVSNPYNVTGITGYQWNFTSASNGWKYNGSAAPQTITTTTNTLSLTADGCRNGSLSGLSVNVMKGLVVYKTYNATATTSQPVMAISGPASFCSGTVDYSIDNLPCNAQVTWSTTGGSLSCTNCSQTTMSGVIGGGATLTATVQSCGSTTTLQKPFSSGLANNSFTVSLYYPQPEGCYDAWSFYVFQATNPSGTGHTGYQWSYRPQGTFNETIVAGTSVSAAISFNNPGIYEVVVRATNPCGVGSYESIKVVEVVDFCMFATWPSNLRASPVPAGNTLSITSTNERRTAALKTIAQPLTRIQIFDKMGKLRIDRKVSGSPTVNTLDVSGLPNDIYILKVFDGKKWWSRQITVQH